MSIFPARSRFRRRQGRCYELAGKTLQHLADRGMADGVALVHGTVMSIDGCPIGHAWLEHEGEAYCAVLHMAMPVAQYVAEYGAVAERRYTIGEASKLIVAQSHWGPW